MIILDKNDLLKEGIMRFDSDLILLQHEYAESFAMQGIKIPYAAAHEVVNKIYNWEKSLK